MIKNGKNTLLNQSSGTVPDVSGALLNWFQKMTFTIISKSIVNFKNVEVSTESSFRGVIQPFTPQQLKILQEGQRAWKWHKIHADPSLSLKPDDKVVYLSQTYRVMSKTDYTIYGYIEYDVIEDYA